LQSTGSYAKPELYRETDVITFSLFPGITLRVGDLFAGAPDTTL
jgi:hypothetical protein